MKAKLIKNHYGFKYLLMDENGETIATSENGKLSLKNCQAIERGYDLDELASNYTKSKEFGTRDTFEAYEAGFQKALEILGDRKFTAEDMKEMYNKGVYDAYYTAGLSNDEDNYIKSLQQNEWEVEIEMEPVFDIEYSNNGYRTEKFNKTEYKPKLDADGCLILKRVV